MVGALLASKDLSLTWSAAVEEAVGQFYTDNVVVAVLGTLRGGPRRPRDLEPLTHRRSASVTRIVDRLEDHGDVRRHTGGADDDHRAVLVRITPRGRRAVDDVAATVVDQVDEVKAPIGIALDHLGTLVPPSSPPSNRPRSPVEVCVTLAHLGIVIADLVAASLEGLDVSATLVLCLLAEDPRGRPSVLSDRLGMTSGGMTKLLDRLESQGLVVRNYGRLQIDRRAVEVTLTPAGAAQLGRTLTELESHAAEMLVAYSNVQDHLTQLKTAS